MIAKEYRENARDNLSGRWMRTAGTTMIATLLGSSVMLDDGQSYFNVTNKIQEYRDGISVDTMGNMNQGRMIQMILLLMPFIVGGTILAIIIGLARFIIGSFVSLGLIQYNLDMVDKKDPEFSLIFSKTDVILPAVLLRLRKTVFEFLWTLLFVIPGIIKSLSYSMSGYILAENPEMSPKEAMLVSMDMMDGNKWKLFCLQLSFIGWDILAALTFGIGYIWLVPYKNAAITEFYNDISKKYQRSIQSFS